jgi:hypothetical protein
MELDIRKRGEQRERERKDCESGRGAYIPESNDGTAIRIIRRGWSWIYGKMELDIRRRWC